MRKVCLLVCIVFSYCVSAQVEVGHKGAEFNKRSRFSLGAGGNLAFKSIGGYHVRSTLQFSPKWRVGLTGTDLYTLNTDSNKTYKHRSFDCNVMHAWKDYKSWDVLYFFEGINVEVWERNVPAKYRFRRVVLNENKETEVELVTSLNVGLGFEKPIGPLAFYAEVKLCIGRGEAVSILFGLRTNFKRIFKDPNARYDLDLEKVD